MTRITVPAGFEPFTGRYAALRAQLIGLVAERDGLPVHGDVRPDFHRAEAEHRADALITEWEKAPRDPADEIDRILATMAGNATDCLQSRQAGRDQRAAREAEKRLPPPATVTLRLLDSATGKQVLVTLPRDAVQIA